MQKQTAPTASNAWTADVRGDESVEAQGRSAGIAQRTVHGEYCGYEVVVTQGATSESLLVRDGATSDDLRYEDMRKSLCAKVYQIVNICQEET